MGKGVDKSGGQITVLYELTLHRIINRTHVKGSRSTDHAFAQLAKEGFDSNQNNKTKTDHENVTKPRLWRKYGHDNGKKIAIPTDRAFVELAKADTKTTIDQWHEAIGDPTIADAILDRLVHNAHRLTLTGESMRKTKTEPKNLDHSQQD